MSWAERSNEERLVAEVLRLRESVTALLREVKAMHLGTAQDIAERALAQNHVSDIINNEESA